MARTEKAGASDVPVERGRTGRPGRAAAGAPPGRDIRDGVPSGRTGQPSGQGGPALMVVAGAACTSSSGMFIKLSEVGAGTAAFMRCALALAVLLPMAVAEYRRIGRRPLRLLALDVSAGVLLGLDYVCWVESIHDLGASIATLLLNVQLLVFPLLARVLTGVRLARHFWLTAPVLLLGLALAGGAIGEAEPGSDPASGVLYGTIAGVGFAGYLFLIRLGGEGGRPRRKGAAAGGGQSGRPAQPGRPARSEEPEKDAEGTGTDDGEGKGASTADGGSDADSGDGREAHAPARVPSTGRTERPGGTERTGRARHFVRSGRSRRFNTRSHTVTPVCASTAGAALSAGVLGALWTGVDLNPGWPAWGWLIPMAFLGQVLAWLLINPALPRLAPDKGATLLLLQPVLAVLFGVGFLGERPTPTQYAGCALVVLAVWRATRTDH